jgi:hypothetical protein
MAETLHSSLVDPLTESSLLSDVKAALFCFSLRTSCSSGGGGSAAAVTTAGTGCWLVKSASMGIFGCSSVALVAFLLCEGQKREFCADLGQPVCSQRLSLLCVTQYCVPLVSLDELLQPG